MSEGKKDMIRFTIEIPNDEWAKQPQSCCELFIAAHIHGPYLPNSEESGLQYTIEVRPLGMKFHPYRGKKAH